MNSIFKPTTKAMKQSWWQANEAKQVSYHLDFTGSPSPRLTYSTLSNRIYK